VSRAAGGLEFKSLTGQIFHSVLTPTEVAVLP